MRSLNLNIALSHDRYLGLPTFVGRNKRRTFAGLIERVWQKTNSWNNYFFSAGAKQAWRILKYPQSLMSRVLKGKYFPNGNFLSAPCKQTASFIWKSIVWGRELLNKGLIWKIGNGLSVKAFYDPWLARPMSFKPVTKNPRMDDPTVAEFLNPLGWNTQLLEESFWPIDIAEITNITLACDLNNPIFDSTSAGGSNWWTTLWNLKLPPKIKFFLWRSCLNALPTKDNLVKRGIKILQSCPKCGEVQESVLHVFFECIYARSLWEDSIFHTQVLSAQSSSYIDRVSLIHAKNATEDFELFYVILWAIWNDMNNLAHNGFSRPPPETRSFASIYLEEFHSTSFACS
ncbi:hypothetical protein UlMin_037358 [Ulmus minor]